MASTVGDGDFGARCGSVLQEGCQLFKIWRPTPAPSVAVSAELTVAERATALQLAPRNASRLSGPSRWIPLAIILAGWLFCCSAKTLRFLAPFILRMGLAARSHRGMGCSGGDGDAVAAQVGGRAPIALELAADSEHLTLNTETASMRWPWSAVTLRNRGRPAGISVRGLLTIAVPSRAFASSEALHTFADDVRAHVKSGGTPAAPMVPNGRLTSIQAGEGSMRTLLRDRAQPLRGPLVVVPAPEGDQVFAGTSAQFALLVVRGRRAAVTARLFAIAWRRFSYWYALPNSLFFGACIPRCRLCRRLVGKVLGANSCTRRCHRCSDTSRQLDRPGDVLVRGAAGQHLVMVGGRRMDINCKRGGSCAAARRTGSKGGLRRASGSGDSDAPDLVSGLLYAVVGAARPSEPGEL